MGEGREERGKVCPSGQQARRCIRDARASEEMNCLLIISLAQHRTAEHSGGSKLRSGTVTVSGEERERGRDGSRLVVEPRRGDGGEDKGVNVMTGDETMRVCESTYGRCDR
jgi:hypothetical protein